MNWSEGNTLIPNPPKKVYAPIPPETEIIGKLVLDAAYKVHTVLGPGLLESVYRKAMKHVLVTRETLAETEVDLLESKSPNPCT